MYVIGGTGGDGVAIAAVHAYDAATDSWTSVASLPAPRSAHTAATLPGTSLPLRLPRARAHAAARCAQMSASW